MEAKFFRPDAREEQFDMRIDRNGQWFHKGSPIGRDKIAKLFSTVLHFDPKNNDYWLITPVEQGRIEVEDVPYIITDFDLTDDALTLHTNLGHDVKADKDHAIFCRDDNGLPYVHVHNNVLARINRAVREKLIDIALAKDGYDAQTGVLSLIINGVPHIIAVDKL